MNKQRQLAHLSFAILLDKKTTRIYFLKDYERNVFKNVNVEKMIKAFLNRVEISVYPGYYIQEWKTKMNPVLIESIVIKSENEADMQKQLSFDCDVKFKFFSLKFEKFKIKTFIFSAKLFFCFYKKNVDYNTFIGKNLILKTIEKSSF
jgi:hypothetical protein